VRTFGIGAANVQTAELTALVLEQEASLTDAGIIMFDKMLGSMFRRADHEHRERMVDGAKALDAATRTLLPMAKAMLAARASGVDLLVAVEGSIGWQRLETLVDEAAATLMDTRRQSERGYRPVSDRAPDRGDVFPACLVAERTGEPTLAQSGTVTSRLRRSAIQSQAASLRNNARSSPRGV
jgi:hypothetical protein